MIQNHFLTKRQHLRQISDILVINGTLTDCPGLAHGKIGIAIFFFHYSRHTGNRLYEDYALDLIEKIQEQIHANSQTDYERGIAGIGVGMNYLFKNNFLEADDDVFDDFDQRIYRAVMYEPCLDLSLYDGLTGFGRYWITRLFQQKSSKQARECLLHIIGRIEEKYRNNSVNDHIDVYCFLQDIQQISGFDNCTGLFDRYRGWEFPSTDDSRCFPRLGYSVTENFIRQYQYGYYNNAHSNEVNGTLSGMPGLDMERPPVNMGLIAGYAGDGMLLLTALNQTNLSWMHLL